MPMPELLFGESDPKRVTPEARPTSETAQRRCAVSLRRCQSEAQAVGSGRRRLWRSFLEVGDGERAMGDISGSDRGN